MRRAVLALHGLLLRVLLPPAFRAEYGEELKSAVRARLESKQGGFAVSTVALLELLDLFRTAGKEWWAVVAAWSRESMLGIWIDFRIALRTLRKAPAFAIITVATLAVGIGANTAIFSVVDGVLLRPLPYPEAERIVRVAVGARPESGASEGPFSDRGYWHFVRNNRSFEAFGAYWDLQLPLTGDGPPVRVEAVGMTLRVKRRIPANSTISKRRWITLAGPRRNPVIVASKAPMKRSKRASATRAKSPIRPRA